MIWRLWWLLEVTLNVAGLVIAWPGMALLDAADWCQRRKWAAKGSTIKPIVDPTFIKSERVE